MPGFLSTKFTYKVRDEGALYANLRGADSEFQNLARRRVRYYSNELLERVRATVAYDTGRMRRLVKRTISDSGLIFDAGWDADDFAREGEPFYPPFVEVGTFVQPAQPSLVPAWFWVQGRFRDALLSDFRKVGDRVK